MGKGFRGLKGSEGGGKEGEERILRRGEMRRIARKGSKTGVGGVFRGWGDKRYGLRGKTDCRGVFGASTRFWGFRGWFRGWMTVDFRGEEG